jgi:hypothetical protein
VALRQGPATFYPLQAKVSDGSAELAVVGRFEACSWLKVMDAAGKESWASRQDLLLPFDFACDSLPKGTYRPPSARLYARNHLAGNGRLTVINGTDQDAVAILISSAGDILSSAYLRAQETVTMNHIPDGAHTLYFATGREWDGDMFTQGVSHQQFDATLTFASSQLGASIWEVTLHPISGGNVTTSGVAPAAFPAPVGP